MRGCCSGKKRRRRRKNSVHHQNTAHYGCTVQTIFRQGVKRINAPNRVWEFTISHNGRPFSTCPPTRDLRPCGYCDPRSRPQWNNVRLYHWRLVHSWSEIYVPLRRVYATAYYKLSILIVVWILSMNPASYCHFLSVWLYAFLFFPFFDYQSFLQISMKYRVSNTLY